MLQLARWLESELAHVTAAKHHDPEEIDRVRLDHERWHDCEHDRAWYVPPPWTPRDPRPDCEEI